MATFLVFRCAVTKPSELDGPRISRLIGRGGWFVVVVFVCLVTMTPYDTERAGATHGEYNKSKQTHYQ